MQTAFSPKYYALNFRNFQEVFNFHLTHYRKCHCLHSLDFLLYVGREYEILPKSNKSGIPLVKTSVNFIDLLIPSILIDLLILYEL